MKLIEIFLIIGILFSYVPVMSMEKCSEENCPEANHHPMDHHAGDHPTGNRTMDCCGYSFHCPMLFDISMSDPMPLPLTGRLIVLPPPFKADEVPYLIFHPPKAPVTDFS